jgi:quercetin dioxygenase-like cupin family protein
MKRSIVVAAGALGIGVVVGIGVDRVVTAQQSGITRTVLQRADDPGSKTHEAVMAVADLAAGASAGRHVHHGIEIGYVLDGSIVIEHQGRAAATKKAGEFFQIDAAAAHDARNTTGSPARILAIYVVEKGKPLAEPVK